VEKRLFSLALSTATLLLGVLGLPLILGQVYPNDDLGIFQLTTRFFYAQSLKSGESFLWWPNAFCGYYLHGEGQVGMYHPFHLLLYRTLPFVTAFNLELLVNYPVLLGGTFFFLRRWKLRRDAAIFGALLFTFSSFNLLHFVHPNIVAVIAHMPWLLLAIEVTLYDSDPRRGAFAKLSVAALTTSQLLLGHPQSVWLSSVIEVLYVLFRASTKESRGRLWSLGVVKLLGLLGGSIQLIPTWNVVFDSVRASSAYMVDYRLKGSLQPINLVQPLAPYLAKARVFGSDLTQEFSLYTGATSSVLGLWLWVRRKALGSMRHLALGALVLGVLGLVLSLGHYGYLYRLQAYLPLVRWLGGAARYIVLLQFATAIAASIAFVDLAELGEKRVSPGWRQWWPLGLLPVGSVLAAGLSLWLRGRPELFPDLASQLASPGYVLIGPLLVTLATALVVAASRGVPYTLAGVILFAAADQGVYGVSALRRPFPPIAFRSILEGQAMPPEVTSDRVQSYNNFLTLQGVRLADGYGAFRPRRMLDDLNEKRLQIAGVRWIQTKTPWAPTQEPPLDVSFAQATHLSYDALGRPSTWAMVSEPMPRARLVTKELASSDPMEDIDELDVESTALVFESLRLEGGRPGTVSIVDDKPGEIRLRARVGSRQLLVLSESWHEGWHVVINGEARPVVRVNGDFIGSVLDEGDREIEFKFQPRSLRLGARLSALAAGLTLLSCFVALRWQGTSRV
jgi:hypothetical protein